MGQNESALFQQQHGGGAGYALASAASARQRFCFVVSEAGLMPARRQRSSAATAAAATESTDFTALAAAALTAAPAVPETLATLRTAAAGMPAAEATLDQVVAHSRRAAAVPFPPADTVGLPRQRHQIVVVFCGCSAPALLAALRRWPGGAPGHVFKIAFSAPPAGSGPPQAPLGLTDRVALLRAGVNMFAETQADLVAALPALRAQMPPPKNAVKRSAIGAEGTEPRGGGDASAAEAAAVAAPMDCPICGFADLTEDQLQVHVSLYHGNAENSDVDCPVCMRAGVAGFRDEWNFRRGAFNLHMHNCHGAAALREEPPVRGSFAVFAWVVVRNPRTGRYLLALEPAGLGGQFWFPAGRVDAGESLEEAAVRETMEEAGVRVRITGYLRFMLGDKKSSLRVILAAEPVLDNDEEGDDDEKAEKAAREGRARRDRGRGQDRDPASKCLPDFESNGSCWATIAEIGAAPVRVFRGRSTPGILERFHRTHVEGRGGAAAMLSVDDPAVVALNAAVRAATAQRPSKQRPRFPDAWEAFRRAAPQGFVEE